jgi:glucokinase
MNKSKFIGVDLGGTHLRAALVDVDSGEILSLQQADTRAREGHAAVIERMAGLIEQAIQAAAVTKSEVGGVGIGAPGELDLERGLVIFLPNLPGNWPNVPLPRMIQEAVGLPVHLLNDARAATFGEWRFGAGRGVETMALFTLGTGVGGGLVVKGKLHLSLGGAAGELGHQSIDFNGPQCGCGNRGCLEVYASGPAIAAYGIKAVVQGLTTRIGEVVGYDLNKINAKTIAQAALAGDTIAQQIYEQVGEYIGVASANVIVTVGPQKIVIGGGVSQAGDLLLNPIRRTIQERVHVAPVEQVQVMLAELGPNAGLVGAACWAAELERQPYPASS